MNNPAFHLDFLDTKQNLNMAHKARKASWIVGTPIKKEIIGIEKEAVFREDQDTVDI